MSLFSLSKTLIEGCKVKSDSGITLYTPDGMANYNALWVRDFSYMVEYTPDLIPLDDIKDCITYILAAKRTLDSWIPDRIYGNGEVAYAAGELHHPIGKANLDNTPFLIFLCYSYLLRAPKAEAKVSFSLWKDSLIQALLAIPHDLKGLIYNDKKQPHSPYGFTDTIAKTGQLFMESLLVWRACRMYGELEQLCGQPITGTLADWATNIEDNIHELHDVTSGMFLAASDDCHQIDIWGSSYALYIGFPMLEFERQGILDYLSTHMEDYLYKGQVRHLPTGTYWQRLLIDVPQGTYQNGAYWATATGWVAWCLAQTSLTKAMEVINACLLSFKNDGVFECINSNYAKLPSFVVSATNVEGAIHRLMVQYPECVAMIG